MADEPYMPGTTVQCLPGAEEMDKDDPEEVPTIMPSLDELDSEPDENDDGIMTAQESTDAEIRTSMASILITHDHEYRRLTNLS